MSKEYRVSPAFQKEKKGDNKDRSKWRWVRKIIIWTLIISFLLSLFSSTTLSTIDEWAAAVLLLIIIFIGIIFDIIGTAVTAASEPPFRAMASRKEPSAKYAIMLIENAEKVSNFCNDVIGDIAGIISGATAAVLTSAFFNGGTIKDTMFATFLTACVAATTVGGKAMGKSLAIKSANNIIYKVAKILNYFASFLPKKRSKK